MSQTSESLPLPERTPRAPRRVFWLLSVLLISLNAQHAVAQSNESDEEEAPSTPAAPAVEPPSTTGETPQAGTDGTAAEPTSPSGFSKPEIAELLATYETSTAERRAQLKATYKDLGVDLESLIGLTAKAAVESERAAKLGELLHRGRSPRTTQAVLSVRTKLTRGGAYPDASAAPPNVIAAWVQDRIVASEWADLGEFLRFTPAVQSEAIYSAVLDALQIAGTSKGEVGVLPEEVVTIAAIAPTELTPHQIGTLAAILRSSVLLNGTDELLARIKKGDGPFGDSDEAKRLRTLTLLTGAGMDKEAEPFLPSLSNARTSGDAFGILVRARFNKYRASSMRDGEEAQSYRAQAWVLFCEVARHSKASVADREDAIAQAVRLMRRLPRAQIEPWLREVFDDERLGPLAMEKMAVDAANLSDEPIERDERTRGIVTLKEAVDILLDSHARESDRMKAPLRIITGAIADQLELATAKQTERRRPTRVHADLLRAIPSKPWLDKIEPSLAARTAAAGAAVLAKADQIDRAIDLMTDAVKRTPAHASRIADRMFEQWIDRLQQGGDLDEDGYYSWYYNPSPVITRGMQHRNLTRLRSVIATLNDAGVPTSTLPKLAEVFSAAHNSTEVYDLDDLQAVFGQIDSIDATTARALADEISNRVDAYWRDRTNKQPANTPGQQPQPGQPKKPQLTNAELIQVVDRGFNTANQLAARARAAAPDSWQTAQMNANIAFRWLAFNLKAGKTDDATRLERLRDVYASLEHAAALYGKAIEAGTEREDPSLFMAWFRLAIGAADIKLLSVDDLPVEGTLQDNQFERIAAAVRKLPPDVAYRHLSELGTQLDEAVTRLLPEVKPRFVKAALRVLADHPAGSGLRARQNLYTELAKDEIKLILAVDGPTEVGPGQPFGVAVSLRVTSAVERESGGFSRYLQNGISIGGWNNRRQMDYRDMFKKTLQEAFSRHFNIDDIGFFDPLFPSTAVLEQGQPGWVEKPMAYLVLSARDKSVDRLPQITMEMQFTDNGGDVNVVIASSTPPISVTDSAKPRPVKNLEITQTLDPRDAEARANDGTIRLEVVARGRGTIPGIDAILTGLDSSIDGYRLVPESKLPRTTLVLNEAESTRSTPGGPRTVKYPEPNDAGIIQPLVERTWTLEYKPIERNRAESFHVPTLVTALDAKLVSQQYGETDLLPITGPTVPLRVAGVSWRPVVLGLVSLLVIGALALWFVRHRRATVAPETPITLPERVTPLSTLSALREWRDNPATALTEQRRLELTEEIEAIELAFFGPANPGTAPDLKGTLDRWAERARA